MTGGQGHHRVHIRKEALKFSSAHMTVFPDGTKESLHGHNYRTELSVDLQDASLKGMVPFHDFKRAMKEICAAWDEKVLVARDCPYMELRGRDGREVEFVLCGKRYVLPADETVFLPVDNVVTETLAQEFCRLLLERLAGHPSFGSILGLQLRIEEITGQGASYIWTPRRAK